MTEEGRVFATWHMTNSCNFKCKYCYYRKPRPAEEPLPVENFIATLKGTGRKWTVGMTGGEPLIYPGFIRICKALTEADIKIAVDTNLSVDAKVKEFIRGIDPAMVEYIYVALHIEEREKLGPLDDFIENLLALKQNNFNFRVNYVLHPELVGRFRNDCAYFGSKGIELEAKPFKGTYRGRQYPDGYSNREKRMILRSNPQAFEMIPFRSKGIRCNAGKTLVSIEKGGVVTRCVADKTPLGHIFDGIRLNAQAESCRVDVCSCFGAELIQDPVVLERLKMQSAGRRVPGAQWLIQAGAAAGRFVKTHAGQYLS